MFSGKIKNALFLNPQFCYATVLIRLCGNRVFRNSTNYEIIYSYEISVLFLRYEKFFGNFSKVVCSRWILSYVYTLRLIRPISCPGECDLMVHRRKYSVIFSRNYFVTYVCNMHQDTKSAQLIAVCKNYHTPQTQSFLYFKLYRGVFYAR